MAAGGDLSGNGAVTNGGVNVSAIQRQPNHQQRSDIIVMLTTNANWRQWRQQC